LLLMIVVPLVFSSLVVGIAGIGDIRKLGRIGLKSFAYTLVISAISVVIGLGLANLIDPGNRISPDVKSQLEEKYGSEANRRVSDAINVSAVSAAYASNVKELSGKIGSIAGETDKDPEAARAFAKNVAVFVGTADKFSADIKKSFDPVDAFVKDSAAITAEADAIAQRADLLGLEAERLSAETKQFVGQIRSARSSVSTPLMEVVSTIVPQNLFFSVAGQNPNMLHIMFFALITGIAITLLPAPVSDPFVSLMEAVFAITTKIIDIVMKFAPYAVACLLFNNIAVFGLDLL